MNRSIAVVVSSLALSSWAASVHADEPERGEAVDATEIVVRAPVRAVPGTAVRTLDETFIERSGATNVGQVLEQLPMMNAASDSRGERVLTLRGFQQRQVAVFVDGVPVLVPYDGQLDLSKFPNDLIDRMTIVQGVAPVLYGPNGLGGAVNLSTREPHDKPWLRAHTQFNASSSRSSLVGSTRAGSFGVVAGAGIEDQRFTPMPSDFAPTASENGGRRNNSDRRDYSLAGKVTYDIDDNHRLLVTASRDEGTFGVPPATKDFSIRYWRWTDWYTTSTAIGHQYRGDVLQTETLAYAGFVGNTLDGYDDGRYSTQLLKRALHSVYDDVSLGGFFRTTITPHVGEANLTINTWAGLKRDLHASYDNTNPDKVHVATNTLTGAALGNIDPIARRLRLTAGLQVDGEIPDKPASGAEVRGSTAVGPLGGVTVFATKALTLTASSALRTRFPTLRERFSTVFGTREPNPGLLPERAWHLGIDAGYQPVKAVRLAAGLFDAEIAELVSTTIVQPGVDRLDNTGKGRIYGAEVEAKASPTEWLELWVGWMFLRAKQGANFDQPIVMVPYNKGSIWVTVRPFPVLAITGIGRWIGPQDYLNPNTGFPGRLDPYGMIDGRVEWSLFADRPQLLRAYARATNLTDANVEGRFSFPEPGRQVFFGLVAETP